MTTSIYNKNKAFSISYDTKDTASHSIDAESLGKSLVSLSKVIKSADKSINGEHSQAKVEVKAHKEGSFLVEFVTWYNDGGKDVIDLLGFGAAITTTAVGTVLGAIKQIQSQKIKAVVKNKDEQSSLILEDDSEISLDKKVAELVTNPEFRKNLDNVIYSPIQNQENARVVINNENGDTIEEISEEEAQYFKRIPSTVLQTIDIDVKDVEIVFTQLNLESDKGWKGKLPTSDNEISLKMKDKHFLDRINQQKEKFVKGDLFKVKLRTTVKTKVGKSQSVLYEIIEVLRHRVESSRKLT